MAIHDKALQGLAQVDSALGAWCAWFGLDRSTREADGGSARLPSGVVATLPYQGRSQRRQVQRREKDDRPRAGQPARLPNQPGRVTIKKFPEALASSSL